MIQCVYVLSRVWLSATTWTIYNSPGSSVHGILQARILEWVAMPSSRGSFQLRNRTLVSHIAGRFFTVWDTREAPASFCKLISTHFSLNCSDSTRFFSVLSNPFPPEDIFNVSEDNYHHFPMPTAYFPRGIDFITFMLSSLTPGKFPSFNPVLSLGEACRLKPPTLARHHSNHLHEVWGQEVLVRNMELISHHQLGEFRKGQRVTPLVQLLPRILLSGIHLGWTKRAPPGRTLSQNAWLKTTQKLIPTPQNTRLWATWQSSPLGFPYHTDLCPGALSQ